MENPTADVRLLKKLYKFFFKFSSKRTAIIAAEYVVDALKRTPEEKWQGEAKEQSQPAAGEGSTIS
jgi:hypothetical protein